MQVKEIKKLLTDPRINVTGICLSLNAKGLSRSSLLNKLNPNHPHELTENDVKLVKKEFEKLSEFINRNIK